MSLDHLCVSLADLDRPAEALRAGREAVAIYQELAATDPDGYRSDLARSMGNLTQAMKLLGYQGTPTAAVDEGTKP